MEVVSHCVETISEHTKPFKQCYVRVFVNEQSSSVHNFITLSVLYRVSSTVCLMKVLWDCIKL